LVSWAPLAVSAWSLHSGVEAFGAIIVRAQGQGILLSSSIERLAADKLNRHELHRALLHRSAIGSRTFDSPPNAQVLPFDFRNLPLHLVVF
jgi:hypothetical protein